MGRKGKSPPPQKKIKKYLLHNNHNKLVSKAKKKGLMLNIFRPNRFCPFQWLTAWTEIPPFKLKMNKENAYLMIRKGLMPNKVFPPSPTCLFRNPPFTSNTIALLTGWLGHRPTPPRTKYLRHNSRPPNLVFRANKAFFKLNMSKENAYLMLQKGLMSNKVLPPSPTCLFRNSPLHFQPMRYRLSNSLNRNWRCHANNSTAKGINKTCIWTRNW